ncbi:hypothetical protein LJK88_34555 [Paenibacillus sp. P26]|nr:hypothetical protein LJK88_34555 [Paenibacillus sp. P26]
MMQKALSLFDESGDVICWATESVNGLSLVIMPRTVKEVLRERLFSSSMPVVFSSATLSVGGSFSYVAESLGIERYLSFSVESSYDYEHQMEVIAPKWSYRGTFSEKMKAAVRLLVSTEGRALILFRDKEELKRFKEEIPHYPECAGMHFRFEGDGEISHLIAGFQREEHSILCAVSLWEGLDVPGPSLSNVIIWSPPFPPHDPVFMAKRQASAAPFEEVDMPYMLLRLRQGMGRLIRSREDRGIVAIFSEEFPGQEAVWERIKELLPPGVGLKESLETNVRQ